MISFEALVRKKKLFQYATSLVYAMGWRLPHPRKDRCPALQLDLCRLDHLGRFGEGTTGPPKGVMLPDALTFTSACTFMRLSGMTRDDVLYSPLPLFHGLSSRMCALPALVLGAHAVIDERFSASHYWERAAQCNATLGEVVHAIVPLIKAQPPGACDRAPT